MVNVCVRFVKIIYVTPLLSFSPFLYLLLSSVVTDDFSMNAVMRLNQYRPGLEYRLTSQTGPVHEPVFTMAVDLNGKTYEATGPSKRAAKLNVATKARLCYPLCTGSLIG